MKFTKLMIEEWQQFQKVEIEFHPRLTILTGANGSGKTTILSNILARHNNWNIKSLSTPKQDKKSGGFSFLTRLFNGRNKSDESQIGELFYDDNKKASIQIHNQNAPQYQLKLNGQQSLRCFFIPSHRSIFRYEPIGNIPFNKKSKDLAFQEVYNATRERYTGGHSQASSFFMKNTLISWAIQGYGVQNQNKTVMASDRELISYFEGFKNVLKKILPNTLGFSDFEIREREIVFICNEGKDEFIFEQASGGIAALIDIAWQIYMYSTKELSNYTVIIDEVENHLHPSMQRQILPDLIDAFPNASFIVSTHSPLIVSSVRDSNIYVLQYDQNNKIISQRLDLVNQAKTATEILDEALGVSVTMPIWAEKDLDGIISKYTSQEITKDVFNRMREDLSKIGLEKYMPEVISRIIGSEDDKT